MAQPSSEFSKTLERWTNRWAEDKTAWHREDTHPALIKYFPSIVKSLMEAKAKEKKIRVLVPLCGKTKDLAFLANHPSVVEVVGIEGVQKAIDELIEENPQLYITRERERLYKCFDFYGGRGISILKGNFFDLINEKCLQKFDFIWDRGSIGAIQPELRQDYTKIISKLVNPGATMLFGTVDRREGTEEMMKAGPPYTVTVDDIKNLYEPMVSISTCKMLEESDQIALDPEGYQRFIDGGLKKMFDVTTMIETK